MAPGKSESAAPTDRQRYIGADLALMFASQRRKPVREVMSAIHLIADLTLDLGEVVHDYLA